MFLSKIICFILSIIMIASFWKIFTKAKKPGWAVLIPIYNMIVLLQIISKPWWWIVLLIIPGVNLIFGIWIAKSFGYDMKFILGLLLLPFVFYPILAFGDSTYKGTTPA